ncbi:MAG: PepSY-associated TM helix domain-containing protein [Candidatus Solibacter sp.]
MSVRTAFLKLHLWVGLAAAVLVCLIAVTGALLVFEGEIDRALNPKLLIVAPQSQNRPLTELLANVRQRFKGNTPTNVLVQARPDLAWPVSLAKNGTAAYINPHTGEITGSRIRDAAFVVKVHRLHTSLLAGRKGQILVGVATAGLIFLMMTGLILWWKRKLLAIKTDGSWRRINFDLHHVSGIYSIVFLFVIVGTGLLMSFHDQLIPVVEVFIGNTAKERPKQRPESTAPQQQGTPAITADRALQIAQSQLPGASPTYLFLPVGPKATYDFGFKFPEDGTPGGRSRVVLDQYSGAVLWLDNARKVTTGVKFSNNLRPLHTGDLYGWPSRILYALAAFSVFIQAISGIVIWALRFFRKKNNVPTPATDAIEVA